MKIAILGGGYTGLTAAFYLQRKGHEVTVYEKQTELGGLASGFKVEGWNWFLERAYHHVFASDSDILDFSRDTGFDDFFFSEPQTSSLYDIGNETYRIVSIDTPFDLLRFPLLSPADRVRAGIALARLKFLPFDRVYEEETAHELMHKWMGNRAYQTLFGELFRKKFGKYAGNILSVFLWARIKKRTKKLGYVNGGFQIFTNYLEHLLTDNKVRVQKGTTVKTIRKLENQFGVVLSEGKGTVTVPFDRIISTLPTPVFVKMAAEIMPDGYLEGLKTIKYLNAACLIVEADKKLVEHAYWLSNCVPDFPMMVFVQHTNMIPAEHYGGKHILYLANYIDNDHPLLTMNADEALAYYKPALDKVNPLFASSIKRLFYFKAPFAQPIFDKEFTKVKPDFQTPVEGFYMANLDMTYPYDRGTNYAVKLGKEVSGLVQ